MLELPCPFPGTSGWEVAEAQSSFPYVKVTVIFPSAVRALAFILSF